MNAGDALVVRVAAAAMRMRAANPAWRAGQCAYNSLRDTNTVVADLVYSDLDADPFYDDARLPAFWQFLTDNAGDES